MGIGIAIQNAKEKFDYKSYADMAKVIGVSSNVLNRLKDVNSKEDMKQESMEVIENISNFLGMTINELINFEIFNTETLDTIEILNIHSDCEDMGIIIKEIQLKLKESGVKLDGVEMNEESKQILLDSLDISKRLAKNKL